MILIPKKLHWARKVARAKEQFEIRLIEQSESTPQTIWKNAD